MTELKLKNVSFKYGLKKRVYENFSIEFGDGITLLLGANGSGKSTMFKLICGVMPPSSGNIEVSVDGEKIKDRRTVVSYIPQNFSLFPSLNVREVLSYVCTARAPKLSKKEIAERVEDAMETADITEYADKKMRSLSGGTRQRVGIAQSVLGDPKIIIADEPTSGLDPEQREHYNRMVAGAAKDRMFVISTHLFEDAEYYENIILISEGKLNFKGTKTELLNSVEGRLYRLTLPMEKFDAAKFSPDFKIIDSVSGSGRTEIKLFALNGNAETNGLEPIKPDLKDAWRCYK